MTTHRVKASDVRTGDILVLDSGNYKVRVTYVALVRGLEVMIKYRSADIMNRASSEKTMTLNKYTMLTVEV